ncbi:claudin-34 [Gymnodraco acuticeps]|uniref:Claudin-34 n=1 Tax=Gymnodraco acuticeps TaxID=8218 RepID=A0A6P8VS66_GYMAC|nr:claudin-34 [Gymnodraco acuticeps]
MKYVAHTAHWQFLGLIFGVLAWILTVATTGLNEWRLWFVSDVSVVTSGVAWVGIWRACFYSHALPIIENCRSISISDSFAPTEIPVAQVLMVSALVCGLLGNLSAAAAMRTVYFSMKDRRNVGTLFRLAGGLYLLTGACSLVPLLWNMYSVLSNRTIHFPPDFLLPAAPARQQLGAAIIVGLFASALMLVSGVLFLCYRYAWEALGDFREPETRPEQKSGLPNGDQRGQDNPAFLREDNS